MVRRTAAATTAACKNTALDLMVWRKQANELLAALGPSEWVYETSEQKKDRLRFEAIYNGLTSSKPARIARTQADLSTRFPSHYLVVAARKPPAPPPYDPKPLPQSLVTIKQLQDKDGKWNASPELLQALGGSKLIPDAPEGVSEWRWITALVMVFIRRHPDHHEKMAPVYAAGERWVIGDPHLMQTARDALPPGFAGDPCYFELPDDAIKSRNWREAAQKLVEDVGYVAFVRKPPQSQGSGTTAPPTATTQKGATGVTFSESPRSHASSSSLDIPDDANTGLTLNHVPAAVRRRRALHRKRLEVLWQETGKLQETPMKVGDAVCAFWRRSKPWEMPRPTVTAIPAIITRVNADGTYDVAFQDHVGGREAKIPRMHIARPGEARYVDWAGQLPPDFSEAPSSETLVRRQYQVEATWRQPRSAKLKEMWSSDSVPAFQTEIRTLTTLDHKVHARPEFSLQESRVGTPSSPTVAATRRAVMAASRSTPVLPAIAGSDASTATGPTAPVVQQPRIPNALQADLEHQVVQAIIVYEAEIAALMREALRGAMAFREAATFGQQQQAFAGTRIGLARVRQSALDLIRRIEGWQADRVQAGEGRAVRAAKPNYGESSQPVPLEPGKPWPENSWFPPPFYWHGEDVLVKMAHSLDFLGGIPELVEWYTDKYPFIRNPFSIALPLDDRPATPRPKTKTVLLDNEPVQQEFRYLVAGNLLDQENVAQYWDRFNLQAPWWPSFDLTDEDLARIRHGERAILVAEAAARELSDGIMHGVTTRSLIAKSRPGSPTRDSAGGTADDEGHSDGETDTAATAAQEP